MTDIQLIERLALALAIGLLIGLERGWEYRQLPEGGRVAGIRTFGLISLAGAVAIQLDSFAHELILPAALIGIAFLMGLGFWRESQIQNDVSATTGIAALVAFGLGALAGTGQFGLAASAAVAVALLLGFRAELHSLVFHIERQELTATLRLLLISVVMLPVLPNRGYGPWAALNPYRLWSMIVMIATLSYLGYFAIKFLGQRRGVLVTGLLGGMISSTAVTLTLAPAARESEEMSEVVAAGVLAASTVMFPRILLIAGIVASSLIRFLAPPLLAAAVVTLVGASWFSRLHAEAVLSSSDQHVVARNPLNLWFALKFGLLLTLIMMLTRTAKAMLGDRGLLAISGISGLADVDAITLSVSSMFNQAQMKLPIAVIAILLAAAVNTLVKPALLTVIAGFRPAVHVWLISIIALAAGGSAYLVEINYVR